MPLDITSIARQPVETLLAGLRDTNRSTSIEAASNLLSDARDSGLNLRDYLVLAVDTRNGERATRLAAANLNGYEAALDYLQLPFHNDLEKGVLLQAAAETFNTFPGTRALFPEVIDDMVRFANRQEQIERADLIVGQSRIINSTEMVSTIVEDESAERGTFIVPELSRIPMRTVRSSETSVRMFKHGSGYQFSYEFNRRASLDIVKPFAARTQRQLEISKVAAATGVLISGDGVNPAAAAATLGSFGADFTGGKTLQNNYKALAKFLMTRAKAGNPVDTLLGNFDTFVELMFMFLPVSTTPNGSAVEKIASMGGPSLQLPILGGAVQFAFSSAMPANRLLCFSKAETLEELVEAGATISENERSIKTQSVTYVNTETTGYKLAFGDTRTILDTSV